MKYVYLLCWCLCCQLGAQELKPELRSCLESYLGLRLAEEVQDYRRELGKAFDAELFLGSFAARVQRGVESEPAEKADCPAAAREADRYLRRYRGDADAEAVVARARQYVERRLFDDRAAAAREWRTLSQRLHREYLPVCRAREQKKEAELLQALAAQPGALSFPNGMVCEVQPGEDDVHDINRGTRETGIDFFTRVTDDMRFADLPELIRSLAPQLPKASCWTFYIPHRAVREAAETARREAEAKREKRVGQLNALLGRKPAKAAEKPREEAEPYAPLMKIRVWRDDPLHPLEVLPDCTEPML